jgi:LacI family transcriptional regulator
VALVGVVLHELDSPFALEVLTGAHAASDRAGAGLLVTTSGGRQSVSRRQMRTLFAGTSPSGVVLVTSEPEPAAAELLATMGTPVVLMDPLGRADPSLPSVGATNWRGGFSATEHLLALGHRRIAVMGGEPHASCAQERVDGYRAAMGRAGVPVDEELVEWGDFSSDAGRASARRLLDLPEPPTAVFAASDMQAAGVYAEARARGLHVPSELSVVGFDDVVISRHLAPPLTTVRQPIADMAAAAVRLALDAGGEAAGPTSHVELTTQLVVRESTAPPPARPVGPAG